MSQPNSQEDYIPDKMKNRLGDIASDDLINGKPNPKSNTSLK